MSVLLDRPKAADLGVSIADAADAIRLLVAGDQVTTFNDSGEQYEVHLRAEEINRSSTDAIAGLPVPSSRLGIVSLDNIASFKRSDSPATINRMGRQRQVTLSANMLPGTSQGTVQEQIAAAAADLNFGSEYRADFVGRSRELNRTATAFLTAIALSFIFMYLILAAQFESWLHPVTILLSLPLTLPFALLSLIIFQQSLNIFSGLGLLVLFGVVKKNSILQIDHANQLREAGMNTHDAVIQASRDRLRPILMTTLAFVAGMIPLVVSQGVGSATNHAIGWVVIGGQTMVLLVTLIVTPVAYSLFDQAAQARSAWPQLDMAAMRGSRTVRSRSRTCNAWSPTATRAVLATLRICHTVRYPTCNGGRASHSFGSSPIGAPGGAGDVGMIRPPAASTIGRSRNRLMSAASSMRCARSPSAWEPTAAAAVAGAGAGSESIQLQRRDRPDLRVRRRLRQPHHAIDQHALFGAPHFLLVAAGRRLIEGRPDQPVDHFAEARQRLIDGVLRHHARRAIRLQHEADRDVGGDRRRVDRIEAFAGGAREQLAVRAVAGRPRRQQVEDPLGNGQLRRLERRGQRVDGLALHFALDPFDRRAVVAAHRVDEVLPADRRRGALDRIAVIHVDRHQRFFDHHRRHALADGVHADPIERRAPHLHQARQLERLVRRRWSTGRPSGECRCPGW